MRFTPYRRVLLAGILLFSTLGRPGFGLEVGGGTRALPPIDTAFENEQILPLHDRLTIKVPAPSPPRPVGPSPYWFSWIAPVSGIIELRANDHGAAESFPGGLGQTPYGFVFLGEDAATGFYTSAGSLSGRGVRFYAVAGVNYHLYVEPSFSFTLFPSESTRVLRLRQLLPAKTEWGGMLPINNFDSPFLLAQKSYRGILYANIGAAANDVLPKSAPASHSTWISWTAPVSGTVKFVAGTADKTRIQLRMGIGGETSDTVHWGRTGQHALGFRCYRGLTYRICLLNQGAESIDLVLQAAGR